MRDLGEFLEVLADEPGVSPLRNQSRAPTMSAAITFGVLCEGKHHNASVTMSRLKENLSKGSGQPGRTERRRRMMNAKRATYVVSLGLCLNITRQS